MPSAAIEAAIFAPKAEVRPSLRKLTGRSILRIWSRTDLRICFYV